MDNHLVEIARRFTIERDVDLITPVKVGHINDTYFVSTLSETTSQPRYVLQRINQYVFKDPLGLMENIQIVTRHLRAKILQGGGDPERETLNLVDGIDGHPYFQDGDGNTWRMYQYIQNARTYESVLDLDHVYKTSWAFGNFQCQLADLPAAQLHETIHDFHNTPIRFQNFCSALKQDPYRRSVGVSEEVQFILHRERDTALITSLLQDGSLPSRVTHNDAKLNNVMIDDMTGKGICIVDLDTVMPGSALYDFGDMVRSITALSAEDEPDWRNAGIAMPIFERLVQGYLDATRDFLTPIEVENLAFAGRLITLEQAIRFLGDYLNGDVYYKTSRPGQNLDRARTQIAMLADMEAHYDMMKSIVEKYR